MSVTSVGSNGSQNLGTVILQQLMAAQNSTNTDSSSTSGLMGDLMSLSPASKQLAQAPAEVTTAMNDLLSGQKDVKGDLTTLQGYFKDNPQSLASVIGSLQGTGGTYGASGTLSTQSALLSALSTAQGSSSKSLLASLMSGNSQDPLLASLGLTGTDSNAGVLSLLG